VLVLVLVVLVVRRRSADLKTCTEALIWRHLVNGIKCCGVDNSKLVVRRRSADLKVTAAADHLRTYQSYVVGNTCADSC